MADTSSVDNMDSEVAVPASCCAVALSACLPSCALQKCVASPKCSSRSLPLLNRSPAGGSIPLFPPAWSAVPAPIVHAWLVTRPVPHAAAVAAAPSQVAKRPCRSRHAHTFGATCQRHWQLPQLRWAKPALATLTCAPRVPRAPPHTHTSSPCSPGAPAPATPHKRSTHPRLRTPRLRSMRSQSL